MLGFEDTTNPNPIDITVSGTGLPADGGIDGTWQIPNTPATSAQVYGLITTVNTVRYLIPWANVSYCAQQQVVPQ